MNQTISQFKKILSQYCTGCGLKSDSILDLLWNCYSDSNPIDDGRVRRAEAELAPVFAALAMKHSDMLSDKISELCLAYQRAAFLEGILIGVQLHEEFDGQ